MSKVISASKAAEMIKDGSTLAASGFGLTCWNEEMGIAIENRFKVTGFPKDLTVIHACALGSRRDATKGMSHLGHEGLVKRWIGGIAYASPPMAKLIENNKIEAYNLPQGVTTQLYREIAAKRPGVITKIGLKTYVDPRLEGGKMNAKTQEEIVRVIELDGEEWLYYKSFPIHVGLIRGTVADENGNLTMEKESLILDVLPIAQAARNSGGIVIAQVENVVKNGTLNPKSVRVPGHLIDYIVISQPENHDQTEGTHYHPSLSGELKVPLEGLDVLKLDERKVIARRCAMEFTENAVLNLGVGIPSGAGSIAVEEGVSENLILTTEAGSIGGVPGSGLNFGSAYNAEATVEEHAQFDFYDGGGLDLSVLGLAQTDELGNVNVSKIGPKVLGCGGFINISQTAKKLIYAGSFTHGGLEIRVRDGQLEIINEGRSKKFVQQVDQVSFSGQYANEVGQSVLYVTERAVFQLIDGKMTLIEIAPGVDLQRDILNQMDFTPVIADDLKLMDQGLFQETWGELKQIMEVRKAEKLNHVTEKVNKGEPVLV
ncbi:acyl CoA:acetate/3-ketoacid CoA transferase [Bacillus sp. B15-48]|uniref:acyl CoA:acetate/3-ketoacid CoA transferase n=1 Tax=Bacillus sp. B15-48 TaxID=1548601 RepID=UPI00193EF799|nr:acyl CoA:acetate/3-ketoacid CoA transferase [Bacillus sp. B15-48]MBM4764680.1 acyl CoA:acetate/3-ketoacid CoA transferase [Bacillus sp. B15-48]